MIIIINIITIIIVIILINSPTILICVKKKEKKEKKIIEHHQKFINSIACYSVPTSGWFREKLPETHIYPLIWSNSTHTECKLGFISTIVMLCLCPAGLQMTMYKKKKKKIIATLPGQQ